MVCASKTEDVLFSLRFLRGTDRMGFLPYSAWRAPASEKAESQKIPLIFRDTEENIETERGSREG